MPGEESRFTLRWDAIDPFDPDYPHLWIKVEHLGRYLFAAKYLASHFQTDIVDIGCGQGYGAVELADEGTSVTAIDKDVGLIEQLNMHGQSGVAGFTMDITRDRVSDRFGRSAFDAAVCFETLEHLVDPGRTLKDIHDALVPEGHLLLSVPNVIHDGIDQLGLLSNRLHRRSFTVTAIIGLLQRYGFSVVEVLGQSLATRISQREAQYIRSQLVNGRIGDEPALHSREMIRRLAVTIGFPEQRDIEQSYSIVVVARKAEKTSL